MKKTIKSTILASVLAATCLNGCSKGYFGDEASEYLDHTINYAIDQLEEDREIHLSSKFYSLFGKNIIKVEQLMNIEELSLELDSRTLPEELSWLNYCIHLKKLSITIHNGDSLKAIHYLPNLESLTILSNNEEDSTFISKKNCSFLERSRHLKDLTIGDVNVERGLIEPLKQLDTLHFATENDYIACNYNLDYTKMTSLNHLIINRPTSFAIHMSKKEVDALMNSPVSIETPTEDGLKNINHYIYNINSHFIDIISNEEFRKLKTDEEKVKTIISYIVSNKFYDEEIKEFGNTGHAKSDFYKDGFAYGALKQSNNICGNFAALFTALAYQIGIESYVIGDIIHAKNLVKIDHDYYELDVTSINSLYPEENKVSPFFINLASHVKPIHKVEDSDPKISEYLIDNNYLFRLNNTNEFVKYLAVIGTFDILFAYHMYKKEKEFREYERKMIMKKYLKQMKKSR